MIPTLVTDTLRLPQWPAGRMWSTMYFYARPETGPESLCDSLRLTLRRDSRKMNNFNYLCWVGDNLESKCWNVCGNQRVLKLELTFSAGSSRNTCVCSRTLAAHPHQTSGHKVIADTSATPPNSEITVCGCHIENLDSRVLISSHFFWHSCLFFFCAEQSLPSFTICFYL